MRPLKAASIAVIALTITSCLEEKIHEPHYKWPIEIISIEFREELLFVDKVNLQIETNQPARFSSTDPSIEISSTGLITRIASADAVAIDIVAKEDSTLRRRIYALGIMNENFGGSDRNMEKPGMEPFDLYVQGWQTLKKLPAFDETYALILNHSDADVGKDWSLNHPNEEGPVDWWKSCDSSLAAQLSEKGKARATELGQIFYDLQYPIARVFASEFCRATQTAALIHTDPRIINDSRLNAYSPNVFQGMLALIKEQRVDDNITLIETHQPVSEVKDSTMTSFPQVIPFPFAGGYIIKISPDYKITFEGAVSCGMFKYWRDKKLRRLPRF